MRTVRSAIAAGLIGLCGACDGLGEFPGLAALGGQEDRTEEGIRTLALLGGSVRVRGPEGYCVDQGASDARGGFAVLAGCAVISDRAAVMPDRSGLITVQFGGPETALVTGAEAELAGLLETQEGQRLLSLSGSDTPVEVAQVHFGANLVIVRFEDPEGPLIAGTTGKVWRAFTDVSGRLVTVSVLSFEREPLSRGSGRTLLELMVNALGEANQPQGDLTPGEG